MSNEIINVAITDSHTLFRETLKNYLSQQEAIQVPVLASDLFDLLNKLKSATVSIVLIDMHSLAFQADDALRTIKKLHPEIKIILLSVFPDSELIHDLLDVGIHGYISKNDEPSELINAIRSAANKKIYRNKAFTEALYLNKQNTINASRNTEFPQFSDREKKILQLLWEEKSNKEIADELFLGVRSIEKIRQEMKEKLGVKSTIGLFKFALRHKIVGYDEQVTARW